jgi:threonine/homoserine/homoserine lactone efflux protein
VYTHIIPAALIVALSPMSILPPILVLLYSDRPRRAGLTYLLGWLAGMTAMIGLVVWVSPAGERSHADAVSSQSRIQLGIGVALIAVAVLTWAQRHRHASALSVLDRLQNASSRATMLIGLILAVANPKFILACLAGGVAINAYAHSPLTAAAGIGFFVVVAGSTTGAPILVHALTAHYADTWMERTRHWVHEHTAALTAGTLLFVGVLLVAVSVGSV